MSERKEEDGGLSHRMKFTLAEGLLKILYASCVSLEPFRVTCKLAWEEQESREIFVKNKNCFYKLKMCLVGLVKKKNTKIKRSESEDYCTCPLLAASGFFLTLQHLLRQQQTVFKAVLTLLGPVQSIRLNSARSSFGCNPGRGLV